MNRLNNRKEPNNLETRQIAKIKKEVKEGEIFQEGWDRV